MRDAGIGIAIKCLEHEKYLPLLARFGYSYVHYAGFETLSHKQLERIAEECAANGLKPFSAHGPSTLLPRKVSDLEDRIAAHREIIDRAAVLKAGRIDLHIATVEGVRDTEIESFIAEVGREAFEEMNARVLRSLARHAAGHGMTIALENRDHGHVADYCKSVDSLKQMIARTGEPNMGICLDTGHAHTHPDLDCARMILEAADLLVDTHFHDNYGRLLDGKIPGNGAINDLHRPPGIGTIDWISVLDALERIDYPYPTMFEINLRTPEDDLATLLAVTRDNWRLIVEARRYILQGRKQGMPASGRPT